MRFTHKSLSWLTVSLFLGTFNDNFFKFLMAYFMVDRIIEVTPNASYGSISSEVLTIAGILFAIPFLIFSDFAGTLADRVSKSKILQWVKFAEIWIMVLGTVSLWVGNHYLLYFTLFLMATQSTFFSPAKYSCVPEIVEKEFLTKANSFMETANFSAIIIGTYVISEIYTQGEPGLAPAFGLLSVVVAVVGYLASRQIKKLEPSGSRKKFSPWFFTEIFKTLYSIRKDSYLMAAIFILSCFWMIGAFLQLILVPFAVDILGGTMQDGGKLFLFVSIGIAVGTFLAGRLSGKLIEFGLVPFGAFLMSAALMAMYWVNYFPQAYIVLTFVGVSAGFLVLPLNTFIQYESPKKKRGKIIAAGNFVNFIGIIIGAAGVKLVDYCGVTANHSLLIGGGGMAIVALITFLALPNYLVRFVLIIFTRFFCRIHYNHIESVPSRGGAILICNRVSALGRLCLMASQQRLVYFVITRSELKWWNSWYFSLMKMIVISDDLDKEEVDQVTEKIRDHLVRGNLVCLPAGKGVTPYERSVYFDKFLHGARHPRRLVVPIYVAGSLRRKRTFFTPIAVNVGMVDLDVSDSCAYSAIMDLKCDRYGKEFDRFPNPAKPAN